MDQMVKLFLLAALVGMSSTCSIPVGWKPYSFAYRASRADTVVFGKVIKSPDKWQIHETKVPGKMSKYSYIQSKVFREYQAELEVYCIIKGDDLSRYVNASGFGWTPGHCVATRAMEGDKAIFFLTRGNFGELTVHEVNVQVASELATSRNIAEVLRSTHQLSQVPKEPKGVNAEDGGGGCPKMVINST